MKGSFAIYAVSSLALSVGQSHQLVVADTSWANIEYLPHLVHQPWRRRPHCDVLERDCNSVLESTVASSIYRRQSFGPCDNGSGQNGMTAVRSLHQTDPRKVNLHYFCTDLRLPCYPQPASCGWLSNDWGNRDSGTFVADQTACPNFNFTYEAGMPLLYAKTTGPGNYLKNAAENDLSDFDGEGSYPDYEIGIYATSNVTGRNNVHTLTFMADGGCTQGWLW